MPKKPAKRPDKILPIRIPADEYEIWKDIAESDDRKLSAWIKRVVRLHVKELKGKDTIPS